MRLPSRCLALPAYSGIQQKRHNITSLVQKDGLSTNIKFTLFNALIRLSMSYVCHAWEFTTDMHPMRLQSPQNMVLRTTGKFPSMGIYMGIWLSKFRTSTII
jgi:hypothetical protein